MQRNLLRLLFSCCAVWTLVAPASAQGVLADRRTFYTFSAAVEVPGSTLAAGKYLFRFADPDSGRHVMQVLSDDGKKVYGTFFAIPTQRPKASDDPEVRLMESAPGVAPGIKSVWYPGERMGRELIYPRQQAIRLARAAKEPVLTTKTASTTAEQTNTGEIARVNATGQDVAVEQSDAAAATSGTEQVENAPRSNPAPVATMASNETRQRDQLPRTASMMPFAALGGLCLIGIGLMLSFVRTPRV